MQVDARQLPPPELVYRDKGNKPKVLRVPSGAWNLISTRLHATAELGAFAVASFDRQDGLAGAGPDSDTSVEVRRFLLRGVSSAWRWICKYMGVRVTNTSGHDAL